MESEAAIREAREAYNALDEQAKEFVANADALTAAEAAYCEQKAAEKEKTIAQLLKKMRVEDDRFQGATFYYHSSTPQNVGTRTHIIPGITRSDSGYTHLFWFVDYTGDDWVFWDALTFVVDGKNYTKTVGYNDIIRDNEWSTVWEVWIAAMTEKADIELFRSIAVSENAMVRFEGKYSYDMEISAKDKQAIADVLALYDAWTEAN